MGRRKIEIKAIKDDRNRSVTFLKRKGGLFKKAHELSVLCSVDVAVIIFGHNKKLYEFSSGDINETLGRYQYYGTAHEHKGPEDFMGKKDMDDDDEDGDDVGSPPPEDHSPPMMAHHLQNQPAFQHMRAHASASPPVPNGMVYHRHASPQPPHNLSRPTSRNQIRRPNSTLAPPPHPMSQAPPPPNNYAYMPNPPFYNPQQQPQGMPPHPRPPGPPHGGPQYSYTHPAPHPQVQQAYVQDQRRQSMPPAMQHERAPSMPLPSPPHSEPQQQSQLPPPPAQQHQQPQPSPQPQHQPPPQIQQQPGPPPPPQPQQQPPSHPQAQQQQPPHTFQSPPLTQPKPLPAAAKNHSIFTPIEESRSLLAAHWGSNNDPPRTEPLIKVETGRAMSIDVPMVSASQSNGGSPPQPSPRMEVKTSHPPRAASVSSLSSITPITRTDSMQTDARRPRLKVQIPSEHSDAGSATAESSPKDTATTGITPARASTEASHSSSVVLPPPSPSASALLSAGASGPPNPFARPPPPVNSNSFGSRSEMETPISALPSRFVENGLLPSPSSFYPEWGFGRDNMLPSPLAFPTPIVTNGPSFRDEDPDRKRKTSEGSDSSAPKRVKA